MVNQTFPLVCDMRSNVVKCNHNHRKANLIHVDLTGEGKYEMLNLTSSENKWNVKQWTKNYTYLELPKLLVKGRDKGGESPGGSSHSAAERWSVAPTQQTSSEKAYYCVDGQKTAALSRELIWEPLAFSSHSQMTTNFTISKDSWDPKTPTMGSGLDLKLYSLR